MAGSRRDDAPLAIVGNLNPDQWIGPVARFPDWDEELLVDFARLQLAGTAGYAAIVARALGVEPVVVSTLGDDAFGRFTRDALAALGADVAGVEVLAGEATPLGMIFVGADGRRAILSTLGAHARMGVAVAERHDARIAGCAEVFLGGAYILPGFSPAHLLPYARRLRARGQTVAFDPSWDPSGWGEATWRDTLALLPEVDVYLPNDEELIRLVGAASWREALAAVADLPGETVLKRGAAGAVWARGAERVEVPGFAVEAVNTIGAGDCFDVAYLYGRRRGWPPADRLRFACALAAMVVAQPGARIYPDAAAVEAFLAARDG
jgi:sugar/nucleoside kinase (ribokinase family)